MQSVEHPIVRNMSTIERSEAQMRVAMQSPEKLKKWVRESGRQWLVFNTLELVDALPWPEGVGTLMQLIACYRDHRATLETGEYEEIGGQQVPVMKGEYLEVAELDRAIRYLIGKVTEKDPSWTLEGSAR